MLGNSSTADFISHYGYLAILLGTMLEGETIVLIAGFLAHQGYLSIPWIIFFAILGSSISDQGLFFLARRKGKNFLQRFPKTHAKVNKIADKMASRRFYLTGFALGFRFLYGLRNISPLFLGVSSISVTRFSVLNFIGAVVWAIAYCLVGYGLAMLINSITGTLAKYEFVFVLLILGGGLGWAFYRRWKQADEDADEKDGHTDGT